MLLGSRPGWAGAMISLEESKRKELGSELAADSAVPTGCFKEQCLIFTIANSFFFFLPQGWNPLLPGLVQSHYSELLL